MADNQEPVQGVEPLVTRIREDDAFSRRNAETFPSTTAPPLPREELPPIPPALLATPDAPTSSPPPPPPPAPPAE